jgi:predicted transcriptional regulator
MCARRWLRENTSRWTKCFARGVRLLQKREEAWKVGAREKIEEGLAQSLAGHLVPGEEVFARLFKQIDEWEKELGPRGTP